MNQLDWYCARAYPRKEKIAVAELDRFGVETFNPRLLKRQAYGLAYRDVVEPAFPGYFFARLNLEEHWPSVERANHVICLVSFGAAPVVVEDSIIEGLRGQAGPDGVICPAPLPMAPRYQRGDRVVIKLGTMRGLTGIFQARKGEERVKLLLDMMLGRTTMYECNLSDIEYARLEECA